MLAKSIKGNSTEEIRSALIRATDDGYAPTIAFVFISVTQDREAVSAILNDRGIVIFGATTAGEFIDGEVTAGGIAMLLLDLNPAYFTVLCEEINGNDYTLVVKEMTARAIKKFNNPAFILSYGWDVELGWAFGEAIIRGMEEVAGDTVAVWGGVAGDDEQFQETFVYTNGKNFRRALIMLVLDADKVMVTGRSASGFKAVGTEKILTKVVDNWIYTLDGEPAADMVLKYMGLDLSKEEGEKFNPGITVFSIQKNEGAPVMRASAAFNWENRSIAVTGDVQEGDRFRLTLPPDFDIVETVTKDAEEVRKTLMPEAEALVMFSCICRLIELRPMIGAEIDGIKNAFGVPMAGFFCYGEFGRATNGKNEFHNLTCCWVALKEK